MRNEVKHCLSKSKLNSMNDYLIEFAEYLQKVYRTNKERYQNYTENKLNLPTNKVNNKEVNENGSSSNKSNN